MSSFRLVLVLSLLAATLQAQNDGQHLQKRVDELQTQVDELKAELAEIKQALASRASDKPSVALEASASTDPSPSVSQVLTKTDRGTLDFLRDTTINAELDTYYAYNFNHPYNRVNLLRSYDVLSNNISINQADVIIEHAPDVAAGRRFGARLDLQFGQATDTLQGNPLNEPRPDIYRNIFQAYGTYVAPLGSGLTIDVGKWASSLGIEGNYTKDQINYSRAFFFDFLPFYHAGLRANYKINNKLAVNYWIVNGTNQTEATNAFKDELFGFVVTPRKTLSWTLNYYLGQDNPDRVLTANCGTAPIQPGLCSTPIRPAPNGRTHIFDSYISWQATPRLTLAVEGDYFISRVWQNPTDGNSSAPAHVDGAAVYGRYQLSKKTAFGARGEYLNDANGLFSGVSQSLKETTLTYDYQLSNGFLMRYEWRRDFSNRPYFFSDTPNLLNKNQDTATVGLIWWFGRKDGSW